MSGNDASPFIGRYPGTFVRIEGNAATEVTYTDVAGSDGLSSISSTSSTSDDNGNGRVDQFYFGGLGWQDVSGQQRATERALDQRHNEKVEAGWRIFSDFKGALSKGALSNLAVGGTGDLSGPQFIKDGQGNILTGQFQDRENHAVTFNVVQNSGGRITGIKLSYVARDPATGAEDTFTVQLDRQQVLNILPQLEELFLGQENSHSPV